MEFHIQVKSGNKKLTWKLIASFDTNVDRDDCLNFFKEKYPDVKFRPIDSYLMEK
jgi:hypothetical protein